MDSSELWSCTNDDLLALKEIQGKIQQVLSFPHRSTPVDHISMVVDEIQMKGV